MYGVRFLFRKNVGKIKYRKEAWLRCGAGSTRNSYTSQSVTVKVGKQPSFVEKLNNSLIYYLLVTKVTLCRK